MVFVKLKFERPKARLTVPSSPKQILKLIIVSSSQPHNVMPEISVIIPVYNAEKYIARCLDALIQQTFRDIEVICIDDGSPDKCPQILDDYANKDSRIRVIHQPNAGAGPARNKGLDAAAGKYIMFCDSDDWYEPTMCEFMRDTIEKHNVALVGTHAIFHAESRTQTKRVGSIGVIPNGLYKLNDFSILALDGILWNKIFRKDVIDKYNIRLPELKYLIDYPFIKKYQIAAHEEMNGKASVYYTPARLYNYNLNETSIIGKLKQNPEQYGDRYFDCIRTYEDIYHFLQTNNLWGKYQKLYKFAYLTFIRYNWIDLPVSLRSRYLEVIREFVKSSQITNWDGLYNNWMMKQIVQGRDSTASLAVSLWLYLCPKLFRLYGYLTIYRKLFGNTK